LRSSRGKDLLSKSLQSISSVKRSKENLYFQSTPAVAGSQSGISGELDKFNVKPL
jgi:hypothetical protein